MRMLHLNTPTLYAVGDAGHEPCRWDHYRDVFPSVLVTKSMAADVEERAIEVRPGHPPHTLRVVSLVLVGLVTARLATWCGCDGLPYTASLSAVADPARNHWQMTHPDELRPSDRNPDDGALYQEWEKRVTTMCGGLLAYLGKHVPHRLGGEHPTLAAWIDQWEFNRTLPAVHRPTRVDLRDLRTIAD